MPKPEADRIKSAKLLVVGSGGIGCELLKCLVLSGFQNIQLVDLDTIDLSNLNRQFLFRNKHVGQPKAKVAAKAVLEYNPKAKITPHFTNIITDPKFDLPFFESFDLVLNALDNLEARRHVNKMCLAADVPLVESGTAGLLGQATVHVPRITECFDCAPHDKPTVFPVCTIRSTPSKPIHCVVWAKMFLFGQLFGANEQEDDQPSEGEDMEELKQLKVEQEALKKLRDEADKPDYADKVFDKVFNKDIQRLAENEEAWKTRDKPVPVALRDYKDKAKAELTGLDRMHKLWSLEESIAVFISSCEALGKRVKEVGELEFEKDDDEMMDFVTAAASIRSHIFSIPRKTFFETKEMAGNIIPAIATSNAIVSGLMVLMATKLLTEGHESIRSTYLTYAGPQRRLMADRLQKPNESCGVCSAAYRKLHVDTKKTTLKQIIETVLRSSEDGFGLQGDIEIMTEKGGLIYDVEFDENEEKSLEELNIKHGAVLTVITDDEPEGNPVPINLFVLHKAKKLELIGEKALPKAIIKKPVPQEQVETLELGKKRKSDEPESLASKKTKIDLSIDEDIILIE